MMTLNTFQPLDDDQVTYYEYKDGFGIYCEQGLPVKKIIMAIDILKQA